MSEFTHQAVLLTEAIDALHVIPNGHYVDATFGRGGHSRALLNKLDSAGRLLAIDRDPTAIAHGRAAFADEPRLTLLHASFAELALLAHGLGPFDGVLLDLGVSSPQLDDAARGFSFAKAGPLDMRMDFEHGESAAAYLKRVDERELATTLWELGEEKFSRQIARAIVQDRDTAPFVETQQLAALVARVVKTREKGKHPATRTFQALRIRVNDELGQLKTVLDAALALLKPGGRLVVISFHSLEDRIVKQFMRGHSQPPQATRRQPMLQEGAPLKLEKPDKASFASDAEVTLNPRARSAVLRAATRSTAP
jgi:16S rRNA (cytosine1402-N4)-methyltransferase